MEYRLGHGFVSSGLFFCVGAVLYDRTHTRLISYYTRLSTDNASVLTVVIKTLCR